MTTRTYDAVAGTLALRFALLPAACMMDRWNREERYLDPDPPKISRGDACISRWVMPSNLSDD
jgi:hypothetical protein